MQKPYNLTPEDHATIAKYSRKDAPAPQIDPRRTDVFRPGPDGKLHPIPGWKTTGPLDVGTWAKNIDFGGVGLDLGRIVANSVAGAGLASGGLAGGLAKAQVGSTVAGQGLDALDSLRKPGVCDCGAPQRTR